MLGDSKPLHNQPVSTERTCGCEATAPTLRCQSTGRFRPITIRPAGCRQRTHRYRLKLDCCQFTFCRHPSDKSLTSHRSIRDIEAQQRHRLRHHDELSHDVTYYHAAAVPRGRCPGTGWEVSFLTTLHFCTFIKMSRYERRQYDDENVEVRLSLSSWSIFTGQIGQPI